MTSEVKITTTKRLRYGLIGVGPVGCTVAAHLVQAGNEVFAYSIDPKQTKHLSEHPIRVRGLIRADGKINRVYTDLTSFLKNDPDVIILATKSCNNETVINEIRQKGGVGKAVVLSCQNGLDIEDRIAEAFGPDHTLRMMMNFGCNYNSSDEIDVKFFRTQVLSLNEWVDKKIMQQIVTDLSGQKFIVELKLNYRQDVFKKVVLNASLGTVCAITGLTMRAAMESPEIYTIILDLLKESLLLSKANGFNLPEHFVEDAVTYFREGGEHKPSMSLDLENGRLTENEDQCGALVRLAEKTGVSIPVTKTIYNLMKNLEKKHHEKKEKFHGNQ